MQPPFESVREQLLRAGIAPRHANRYVTELREHLADLAAQQRASGMDAGKAREHAMALMGSDAQLAQAMIDRGAPRSIAARAPWSVFALLPVLSWLLVIGITFFAMSRLLWPVRGLAPMDMPAGYTTLIAMVSFVSSYLVGPLLAAGCIVIALRQRLASSWVWVGLVLVALISGPVGFHMHYIPSVTGKSETLFSGMGIVYVDGSASLPATLSVAALRAAVLFTMAALAYRGLQSRFMPIRP
jgi:hypothetical protein